MSNLNEKLLKLNLFDYIETNKNKFKPPVNNLCMYGKAKADHQFTVMIIGGPNQRSDYHINEGSEQFWQIKGDMILKIVFENKFCDIYIKENECFMLPPKIPHSPQRFQNTIGMVIERERNLTNSSPELDGLRQYCSLCREIVFEKQFECKDLGSQLAPIILKYYSNEKLRLCANCGTVDSDIRDREKAIFKRSITADVDVVRLREEGDCIERAKFDLDPNLKKISDLLEMKLLNFDKCLDDFYQNGLSPLQWSSEYNDLQFNVFNSKNRNKQFKKNFKVNDQINTNNQCNSSVFFFAYKNKIKLKFSRQVNGDCIENKNGNIIVLKSGDSIMLYGASEQDNNNIQTWCIIECDPDFSGFVVTRGNLTLDSFK